MKEKKREKDFFILDMNIMCRLGKGSNNRKKRSLHVYFSKAHPRNRRYSARIKASNVYNTWAPVNPIVQGTSCAG